jgi:AcrR family transcriptional regulator
MRSIPLPHPAGLPHLPLPLPSATPIYFEKTSRGEETCEKLLRAGLKLFGQRGFDGVSARELAATANTPLSAVTYHFGTMNGLYAAVMEKMVDDIAAKVAPKLPILQAALHSKALTAQQALDQLTEHLVYEIACSQDEPEWPLMMMREHLRPTPAFEAIYARLMMPVHGLICEVLTALRGTSAYAETDIQLQAFAHLGKIIFFNIGSNTICRRMAWHSVGDGDGHLSDIVRALNV